MKNQKKKTRTHSQTTEEPRGEKKHESYDVVLADENFAKNRES